MRRGIGAISGFGANVLAGAVDGDCGGIAKSTVAGDGKYGSIGSAAFAVEGGAGVAAAVESAADRYEC